MDILFELLYYEIMEGYKVATCQRGYFRDCSNDKDALKECQSYGNIVKNARETHQKNSFGHGLILLKLSDIEEKLDHEDTYSMVTNLTCPKCETFVLVYTPKIFFDKEKHNE